MTGIHERYTQVAPFLALVVLAVLGALLLVVLYIWMRQERHEQQIQRIFARGKDEIAPDEQTLIPPTPRNA